MFVSFQVREAFGPGLLAKVASADLDREIQCQWCHGIKEAGVIEQMAVVGGWRADGSPVVGFAHRQCRDRHGDILGIDEEAFSEVHTSAAFVIRRSMPRSVLFVQPGIEMTSQQGADLADLYLQALLGAGFDLVRATELEEIAGPVVEGFDDTLHDGLLALRHPDLATLYEQPLDTSHANWLHAARSDHALLVVAGTGMQLERGPEHLFGGGGLTTGVLSGGVVAGVIPVTF